jgi:hypothetical protein
VIGDNPLEIWACKLLRRKHFHGVSSASPHAYSLKSRYGKARIFHGRGTRKTHAVLRDLLTLLARPYAPQQVRRIYVVVDNDRLHKAKAVRQWLATQPRFELLWLPTSCPRANPLERAFGDVHDKCPRNHKRKRLRDVVGDVEQHLHANGPWLYKLSRIYQEPEMTAAVERIAAEAQPKRAA